jgi:septum formation protein
MNLVLASASPARKSILMTAGIEFEIDPSNYEEDMTLELLPEDLAIHLSMGKASDVAPRHPSSIILAADSFAVAESGELLGKPYTIERAKSMLKMLSGRSHKFITGYTLLDSKTSKVFSEAIETKLFFRKLSDSEINSYISKENILQKAGAYSMQGLGAALVERIDGDYSNVCGLPLSRVVEKLNDFGITIL